MNKKKRFEVYNKYNGKCAYTGTNLKEDWQIDHLFPKCRTIQSFNNLKSHEDLSNLVPCQGIINHYKRGFDLEMFRDYMNSFHIRLAKLPKKPKTERSLKRIAYMMSVSDLFNITTDKPFSGVFYFESISLVPKSQ